MADSFRRARVSGLTVEPLPRLEYRDTVKARSNSRPLLGDGSAQARTTHMSFAARVAILLAIAVSPLAAQSRSGSPRLLQGPMVGAVTPTSARLWVRVSHPCRVHVEFARRSEPDAVRMSAPVDTSATDDYTAHLTLAELEAGTEYLYVIRIDGGHDPYQSTAPASFRTAPAGPARFAVAFGSCARVAEEAEQPIWHAVRERRPDLFLWLGDNIYGDALDPQILAEEYRRQRGVAALQPLLKTTPQLATWDDHDFALNNGDRRNPVKAEALAVFARYWANPAYGQPEAPGTYFRYAYGGVDFFFLDVRTYRHPNAAPDVAGKSMLGSAQIAWLRASLQGSTAPFKVLVSGSGWTSAKGPGGDSWAAFLHERDALFDFVRYAQITGVVLLSGDTHVSELNAVPWSARGGYDLYDLVSSPLAQNASLNWLQRTPEMRIRRPYSGGPSFGLLEFDLTGEATLTYRAVGTDGREVGAPLFLRAAELQNGVVSWPDKIDPEQLRLLEANAPGPWALQAPRVATLPDRGICAHRGAAETHPENTLAAFVEAARLGAHMIEFDVRLTRDGEPVVIHDATVDRTTDGSGAVAELTLTQVRALDAGGWKAPRFVGARVPTLGEALAVMPDNVWLNVHLKGGAAVGAAAAVARRDAGRLHQAFLACDRDAATAARAVVPGVRIGCMDRQGGADEYVRRTRAQRAAFVQLTRPLPQPEVMQGLARDGIRVNFYGTDEPAELADLLAAGVQFPLTDRLRALLDAARDAGIAPNTPRWNGQSSPVARLDARAFGAVGDGVADDAPAIQRALDAAADAGGGCVVLPPSEGAYLIRSTLRVRRDHVELAGYGATLRLADDAHGAATVPSPAVPSRTVPTRTVHCVAVGGTAEAPVVGARIRGLAIDANFWSQPGAYRPRAIQCNHVRDILVEDVTIDRAWVGLTFGGGVDGAIARNVRITRWHNDAYSVTGDGTTRGCRAVRFEGCVAEGAPDGARGGLPGERDSGFEFEDGCCEVVVAGCAVRDAGGDGFTIRNHVSLAPVTTSRVRFTACTAAGLAGFGFAVHDRGGANRVTAVEVVGCDSDTPVELPAADGVVTVEASFSRVRK